MDFSQRISPKNFIQNILEIPHLIIEARCLSYAQAMQDSVSDGRVARFYGGILSRWDDLEGRNNRGAGG